MRQKHEDEKAKYMSTLTPLKQVPTTDLTAISHNADKLRTRVVLDKPDGYMERVGCLSCNRWSTEEREKR